VLVQDEFEIVKTLRTRLGNDHRREHRYRERRNSKTDAQGKELIAGVAARWRRTGGRVAGASRPKSKQRRPASAREGAGAKAACGWRFCSRPFGRRRDVTSAPAKAIGRVVIKKKSVVHSFRRSQMQEWIESFLQDGLRWRINPRNRAFADPGAKTSGEKLSCAKGNYQTSARPKRTRSLLKPFQQGAMAGAGRTQFARVSCADRASALCRKSATSSPSSIASATRRLHSRERSLREPARRLCHRKPLSACDWRRSLRSGCFAHGHSTARATNGRFRPDMRKRCADAGLHGRGRLRL